MAGAGQVTLLARHGDEFARVEHLLQLAVRSTAVTVDKIWSVSNPQLAVQYERRAGGLLALDSWVDVNSLEATHNDVQEVCKRGFQVADPSQGLTFNVGNIKFDAAASDNKHQYLLCSVAVGRSHVLGDAGEERKLPAGYDSLYAVPDTDAETLATAEAAGDAYQHTYIVMEGAQVLPRYIVHFGYDPAEKASRKPVQGVDLAQIKSQISAALAVLGPQASAATEKMLSDIGSAYESAVAASQAPDPLLEERRRSIREALTTIDGKLSAIRANSASVEEALYQMLQDALFALQDETQRKMNALLSADLELRRQLQALDWHSSFVGIMQHTLPPMSFVSAWEKHTALKASLHVQLGGKVSTRALDDIQPDMRLVGHINVVTAASAAAAAAASSSPAATSMPSAASTQAGRRFFGLTTEPAATTSASGGDLWSSMLLSSASPSQTTATASAASGASTAAAAASGSTGGSGIPILTADQAAANLALAKANLAAVEAAAAALPRGMARQGELAKAEASARVVEAEALVKSLSDKEGAKATAAAPPPPPPAPSRPTPTAISTPGPAAASFSVGRAASLSAAASAAAAAAASQPDSEYTITGSGSSPGSVVKGGAHSAGAGASVARTPAAPSASLDSRVARFSLKKEADRKRRARGMDVDRTLAFPGSRLLSNAEALTLFTCLPFGAPMTAEEALLATSPAAASGLGALPPLTRLLFATYADAPSTQGFLAKYLSSGHKGPTVVLVKANGQVFGGYAADGWDFSGFFGGSPRSFLFSVTKDTKIPYTGRAKGPPQENDELLRQAHELANLQVMDDFNALVEQARQINGGSEPQFDEAGRLLLVQYDAAGNATTTPIPVPRPKPFVRHNSLRSTEAVLQFGLKDLVLRGDFSDCSSELEATYGVGLRENEARTFLAEAGSFRAEAVEVWAVMPVEGNGGGHYSGAASVTGSYTA